MEECGHFVLKSGNFKVNHLEVRTVAFFFGAGRYEILMCLVKFVSLVSVGEC